MKTFFVFLDKVFAFGI